MILLLISLALVAACTIYLAAQVHQENQKALARQAKTRSELVPLLDALIKALDVENVWGTSRR